MGVISSLVNSDQSQSKFSLASSLLIAGNNLQFNFIPYQSPGRIPCRKKSDAAYGDKHIYKINPYDLHGVSVDHERARACEGDQAETLLEIANEPPDQKACHRAEESDEHSFGQ